MLLLSSGAAAVRDASVAFSTSALHQQVRGPSHSHFDAPLPVKVMTGDDSTREPFGVDCDVLRSVIVAQSGLDDR